MDICVALSVSIDTPRFGFIFNVYPIDHQQKTKQQIQF